MRAQPKHPDVWNGDNRLNWLGPWRSGPHEVDLYWCDTLHSGTAMHVVAAWAGAYRGYVCSMSNNPRVFLEQSRTSLLAQTPVEGPPDAILMEALVVARNRARARGVTLAA